VWDFAGVQVPTPVVAELEQMRDCLARREEPAQALRRWLEEAEIDALIERCERVLDHPVLPEMYPWRCVPWPLV
jgi:hypothetical protein